MEIRIMRSKSKYRDIFFKAHQLTNDMTYFCDICNKLYKVKDLSVHHVIPIRAADHLKHKIDNMILVCDNCDRKLHPENSLYHETYLLKKKIRWLEAQNKMYLEQIQEFQSDDPDLNFLLQKTNKRLHDMINLVSNRMPEIEIPEKWSDE